MKTSNNKPTLGDLAVQAQAEYYEQLAQRYPDALREILHYQSKPPFITHVEAQALHQLGVLQCRNPGNPQANFYITRTTLQDLIRHYTLETFPAMSGGLRKESDINYGAIKLIIRDPEAANIHSMVTAQVPVVNCGERPDEDPAASAQISRNVQNATQDVLAETSVMTVPPEIIEAAAAGLASTTESGALPAGLWEEAFPNTKEYAAAEEGIQGTPLGDDDLAAYMAALEGYNK